MNGPLDNSLFSELRRIEDDEGEEYLFDGNAEENQTNCRRKQFQLFPGNFTILRNCFQVRMENVTDIRKGTQRVILTFKINQTAECLDRVKVTLLNVNYETS